MNTQNTAITAEELSIIVDFIVSGYAPGFLKKAVNGEIYLKSVDQIATLSTVSANDKLFVLINRESAFGAITFRGAVNLKEGVDRDEINNLITPSFSEEIIKELNDNYRALKTSLSRIAPLSLEEGIKLENIYFGHQVPQEYLQQIDPKMLYGDLHVGVHILFDDAQTDSKGKNINYVVNLTQGEEILDKKVFNTIIELTDFIQKFISGAKKSSSLILS